MAPIRAAGLGADGVVGFVNQFGLERSEEALQKRIVDGITFAAHGAARADAGQGRLVGGGSVLRPADRA